MCAGSCFRSRLRDLGCSRRFDHVIAILSPSFPSADWLQLREVETSIMHEAAFGCEELFYIRLIIDCFTRLSARLVASV